ncbi:bacillithiol biosynthesis deacetylase BshB1 [Desulfotomaculum sp. 1211_IL3151]|uniref:bacillithiol biosynthesis deacetylase BshB1 n=1 Tax=Desulfotomaculum sp. 1211_IL3151 TaxID=3084055 RepID=UPI002FDB8DF7
MAIGAHPDDVEVGAGGLVARFVHQGIRVGIVDLAAGEMSTNGTVEERRQEAQRAALMLGAVWRKCLGLPDRDIALIKENVQALVTLIRESKPQLIICPYWEDRHPDHVNAAKLTAEANFDAGLKRIAPHLPPHRAKYIWHYFLSTAVEPQFVVDVSPFYEIKRAAIKAHQTQFGKDREQQTFLNTGPGSMLSIIESRDRFYGARTGCMYGEGFITTAPLAVKDPSLLMGV